MQEKTLFEQLGPNEIMHVLDQQGLEPDGRITALNSYENRVYRVGCLDADPIVVKFYRPQRWSDQAILEEHQFCYELDALEIPVVVPIKQNEQSLFHFDQYRFSIYACLGGRPPELDNPEQLMVMGRIMARIHNIGAQNCFQNRPQITVETFASDSREFLLNSDFLPADLVESYATTSEALLMLMQQKFQEAGDIQILRLHGDAHAGNILWSDELPWIMDFDDARMGPAIQDIWMFLSGDTEYMAERLRDFMTGYTQFREFNLSELALLETFRTLRIMHYAAWLARRWQDPAFPMAFPDFNTQQYWENHILTLKEQTAMLYEAPLPWLLHL